MLHTRVDGIRCLSLSHLRLVPLLGCGANIVVALVVQTSRFDFVLAHGLLLVLLDAECCEVDGIKIPFVPHCPYII